MTPRIGSRDLIANSDAYVAGRISFETFHARACNLWDAIQAQGQRSKSLVTYRIRVWHAQQMAKLPRSHGGTSLASQVAK